MDLMSTIAERLGVEIGERFKLKSSDCEYDEIYRLKDGLEVKGKYGFEESCKLKGLLTGVFEIIKLPFEPKDGEQYWYVLWNEHELGASVSIWRDNIDHYQSKYCGNVFRTQLEAEMHKYEIFEKLTGEKWER